MARDISSDIDRLSDQLADLRSALMKQASSSASEASSYLAPRARQVARQLQHGSHDISTIVRRNPGTATSALLSALAIGAAIGFLLYSASSERD
jgi:hypothetical protein